MMIAFEVYMKEYELSSKPVIDGGGRWKKFIWLVVKVEFRKWQAGQSSSSCVLSLVLLGLGKFWFVS
jgi:hypothetical protein